MIGVRDESRLVSQSLPGAGQDASRIAQKLPESTFPGVGGGAREIYSAYTPDATGEDRLRTSRGAGPRETDILGSSVAEMFPMWTVDDACRAWPGCISDIAPREDRLHSDRAGIQIAERKRRSKRDIARPWSNCAPSHERRSIRATFAGEHSLPFLQEIKGLYMFNGVVVMEGKGPAAADAIVAEDA